MKRFVSFFLLLSFFSFPAYAQEVKTIPTSRAQLQLSYAPVVKSAAPAVVNIYTRKIVQRRSFSPFLNDPFFQNLFGRVLPEGPSRRRLENSLGSGVVVRPDGLIVTSNHVIAGADEVTVVLPDRREFAATLVFSDEKADLAVLRIGIKDEKLPYLEIQDSDLVEVGDPVLAIGNPFGVGQTVTSGIISALARTTLDINDFNYFIQTDAAINPGNSGGALVSMEAKLVGINAAIYSRDGGNMGIGFAVPSNMVRAVLHGLEKGEGTVVRPWTGIEGQPVSADIAASLGLARPIGLLVKKMHPESPALKIGLRAGDVIVSVSGKTVEDPSTFFYRIAVLDVDSHVELEVYRAGSKKKVKLPLIAPPEIPLREELIVAGANPLSGASLANLSPALQEERSLRDVPVSGVVILSVQENSTAARLGLGKGDVLEEVNGVKIASTKQAKDILENRIPSGHWKLIFNRAGERLSLYIGG